MQRVLTTTVLLAAALVTPSHHGLAQGSNPLLGKWSIEYERGRRMQDGVATPLMGTGTLTIAASGDSLLATLQAGSREDGTVPPPATFGGRASAGAAVFVQQQTVTVNINGETQTRQLNVTWKLSASGDVLTGTMARDLPGMEQTPAPVKGTRAK
jgi:hypothetical protein